MVSVNCGDWHLSWGLGGNNKLGKLSTEDFKIFTWKGYSQGRHGRKSNIGAEFKFELKDGVIVEVERKGGIPISSEIYKAITELKWKAEEQKERKVAKLKREAKAAAKRKALKLVTQLDLF